LLTDAIVSALPSGNKVVRPDGYELRGGRWVEVDFDSAVWTIPAERMKKRREHVVPLSSQALALLQELKGLTGDSEFMFPGIGPKHPMMSEPTINMAIKRAGYEGRHTGHGFRASFSTILNDAGYRADAIEYAIAHVSGNRVRAAYNRGTYLEERRELMQAWADMLDGAEAGNVIAIGAKQRAA
jgi:integrase